MEEKDIVDKAICKLRHRSIAPLTIGLLFCERMCSVVASWYSRVMVWAGPAAAGGVSGGTNEAGGKHKSEEGSKASMSGVRVERRDRGFRCRA
jgi:hypothetical protein